MAGLSRARHSLPVAEREALEWCRRPIMPGSPRARRRALESPATITCRARRPGGVSIFFNTLRQSAPLHRALGRQVLELGPLLDEDEPDNANRAVSLLSNDDLGYSLLLGIFFLTVNILAVNEEDNVRVLLN